MIGHVRCALKRAAILQISGNARRPERVIANPRDDARLLCASLDHGVGIGLGQASRLDKVFVLRSTVRNKGPLRSSVIPAASM